MCGLVLYYSHSLAFIIITFKNYLQDNHLLLMKIANMVNMYTRRLTYLVPHIVGQRRLKLLCMKILK